MRILFVCSGNTCRSPMAEIIFREEAARAGLTEVESASAGFIGWGGALISPQSAQVLAEGGYAGAESFRSRGIDPDRLQEWDWIFTMTRSHAQSLWSIRQDLRARILPIGSLRSDLPEDVEDPYGGSGPEYRQAFETIRTAVLELVRRLKAGEALSEAR